MIVTACAANAQAEKHRRSRIHEVSQGLDPVLIFHLEEHVAIRSHAEVASTGAGFRILRPEFIGRKLFLYKAVIRLVLIERLDHPVAEAPGFQVIGVLLKAAGVAVAHQVEPMASPLLAVTRRGQ